MATEYKFLQKDETNEDYSVKAPFKEYKMIKLLACSEVHPTMKDDNTLHLSVNLHFKDEGIRDVTIAFECVKESDHYTFSFAGDEDFDNYKKLVTIDWRSTQKILEDTLSNPTLMRDLRDFGITENDWSLVPEPYLIMVQCGIEEGETSYGVLSFNHKEFS